MFEHVFRYYYYYHYYYSEFLTGESSTSARTTSFCEITNDIRYGNIKNLQLIRTRVFFPTVARGNSVDDIGQRTEEEEARGNSMDDIGQRTEEEEARGNSMDDIGQRTEEEE